MTASLFCFGLGYSARHLIRHLQQPGGDWRFAGTRRSLPDTLPADIDIRLFDGESPLPDAAHLLRDVTHMLVSIPPHKDIGDPVLYHHGADITRLKNLKWIGYLSTTGVYGDQGGAWVDDDTPPAPTAPRGHLRLAAERAWLERYRTQGLPVHIFRLGSIYGPGRGQIQSLREGKLHKFVKPGQYFSRIHVADIARVLAASMAAPAPGQSYNVVDDLSAPSAEVIDYICDLLDHPPLPAIDIDTAADISPLMRSFYSESKQVRNTRIKQELGVTLKYPTYREGFRALLD